MAFLNCVKLLKLVGWEVSTTDKTARFKFNDGIHSVPKYEIRVDEHLYFIIRVIQWTTLKVETFANRNFREFREFWPFSRKFMFAKCKDFAKKLVRESFYL